MPSPDEVGPLARFAGNIFTEKVVGLAFAIAFGSWSYNLYGLKETMINAAASIQQQQEELKQEVQKVEVQHANDKLQAMADMITVRERQIAILARLDKAGL
jgi:hypothetical protein